MDTSAVPAYVFPMSFAQQRLWFLDQLAPANAFYNIHGVVPLRFAVEPHIMEASVRHVVLRHEALRTTCRMWRSTPVQVVVADPRFQWSVVDLTASDPADRDAEVTRRLNDAARTPFDLQRGPLLRVQLLALQRPADWLLAITVHHIVADGWSMAVLFRDLGRAYSSLVQGEPPPLARLGIQYADFAVWQRGWFTGRIADEQLTYWKGQLSGLTPLALPTDRRRPANPSFRGARAPVRLDAALSDALRRLSDSRGVTMFMTLLAGFAILLHRYSGSDDVAIGSPIAGRTRTEVEDLIGLFVNTLVLRIDLDGDPSTDVLLARVREITLAAFAHQDLPFERLVEVLQPARDLGRNPLCQVLFQLHGLREPHDEAQPFADRQAAAFDLVMSLLDAAEIHGFLEFSTELFEPRTAERLIEHYGRLLREMVADPSCPVSRLPLRDAMTPRGPIADRVHGEASVLDAIDRVAGSQPAAIAVDAPDGVLSYAELCAASQAVARRLRHEGIERGAIVALALERSATFVAAVLGAWRAGAAYLPLDPAHPVDRLRHVLADSGARLVLTTTRHRHRLPAGVPAVALDDDAPAAEPMAEVHAADDDLAYVIYTSGTTGQPKGVLLEHRGLRNVVAEQRRILRLTPAARVLQCASTTFDASLFEILAALGAGATLMIPDADEATPGPALNAYVHDRAVSCAVLPPSILTLLSPESLPDLTIVAAAGEVCPIDLADRWSVNRRFLNLYGPTETTIWATAAEHTPDGFDRVSIGQPIANVEVEIVDAALQPVPIGVPGEICIGGVGVARGYTCPKATAAAFVHTPRPVGRLYRTGDRGRWRTDGGLDFLGRRDRQVKLRGLRIELDEIEAVIQRAPGVAQAAVVVATRPEAPEDQRLFAFVVAAADQPCATDRIAAHAAATLPAYMVPAIRVVEGLPRTRSGKLDRDALVGSTARPADAAGTAATTPTERRVAEIWSQVLGLAPVRTDANFFAELGGHSLVATQVVSRIRDAFRIELPLRALFESPTVHALARVIDEQRASQPGA